VRTLAAWAVIGLLLAGHHAHAQTAPTREQALHDLRNGQDVDARRRGAQGLGDTGTMSDLPALVDALRDGDPVVRGLAEQGLWEVWSRSGDLEVDRLLALGIEQMGARNGDAAVATFTEVIRRKPEFAEGWNKRATIYYLMGEYAKSLADCDEVMKRNPYHYGALSGYGMIHLQLGHAELALAYFERALAINPNLRLVDETVQRLRRLILERRRETI
jgi:tetratricopeptide (TPR) repeat protein